MSFPVIEKTESNVVIKEYAEDFTSSSSYESAMEALSSLITIRKRGEKTQIGGRYKKLERMLMYLKVNTGIIKNLIHLTSYIIV